VGCPGFSAGSAIFDGSTCVTSALLFKGAKLTVAFPVAGNFKLVCLVHTDPACHHFAGTPADLNYLASAASCAAALCSAALTAARNESVPEGACTLPDNVLSKETFFP